MLNANKLCIFESGNYKVVYKELDDPRMQRRTQFVQVSYSGKPEWHLDFHNMIVESWEDADDLVHQLKCLVRDLTEGE